MYMKQNEKKNKKQEIQTSMLLNKVPQFSFSDDYYQTQKNIERKCETEKLLKIFRSKNEKNYLDTILT